MNIRCLKKSDIDFLYDMCYEAIYVPEGEMKPSKEAIMSNKDIVKYVKYFGCISSDRGIGALDEKGQLIGAAWYRVFDSSCRGYGYISDTIPEVSMAVKAENRGQGIGTKLLENLISKARDEEYSALSLSVDPRNSAVKLYEKLGFKKVGECGSSWTMKLEL
jgi:GNAT superfamily N-acetyltransferase